MILPPSMLRYQPDKYQIKYEAGEADEPIAAPIDNHQNDKIKGEEGLKLRLVDLDMVKTPTPQK